MVGCNVNIYFPEQTYNKLRQIAGTKISRFVSAAEEKIARTEKETQQEFRQLSPILSIKSCV